jgi:hypothetical protein
VNDTPYPVRVTFNPATNGYRLSAERLHVDFIPIDERTPLLIRAINDTQSFTVVPEDRDVIYVPGSFYAPALKFGPNRFNHNTFHVSHYLHPSKLFADIATGKGNHLTASGDYDHYSLFGVIDGWKNGFHTDALRLDPTWSSTGYVPEVFSFTPSVAICDDRLTTSHATSSWQTPSTDALCWSMPRPGQTGVRSRRRLCKKSAHKPKRTPLCSRRTHCASPTTSTCGMRRIASTACRWPRGSGSLSTATGTCVVRGACAAAVQPAHLT